MELKRIALALTLATATWSCSGQDEGSRPSSQRFGGTVFTHESGPCDVGEERVCGQTIEQANGIMTCYRGRQVCEDGLWAKCSDGVVTKESDPTAKSQLPELREFSLSLPASCADNPCDPGCMYFDEDPTDITPPIVIGTPTIPNWQTPGSTATCSHELCEEGVALDPTCHGCVQAVCDSNPSCCTGNGMTDDWDDSCVDLVYTACGDYPVPPRRPDLCDLAAFGENNIRFGNGGTGRPQIASKGDILLETNCDVGSIYSKGLVNLRNGCDIWGEVVTEGSAFLEASPSTILHGSLWTGGYAELRNGSTVTGDVAARTTISLSSNATIQMDAWAGGNIDLSNPSNILGNARSAADMTGQPGGRIWGTGQVSMGRTISPNLTVGTPIIAGTVPTPLAPVVDLPTLDDYRRDLSASCAVAATRPDSSNATNVTLPPGVYGDLLFASGANLILQSGGTYIFNSLRFNAGTGGIRLAGTAPWDVSICGQIYFDTGRDIRLNGSATKNQPQDLIIYSAATSGDGISIGNGTTMDGVFIAPDSQIRVYNSFQGRGAFWGQTVYTDTGIDLSNMSAADCEAMDLGGGNASCDGSTELYTNWGGYSIGERVHRGSVIYECTNAWCGDPAYTPGVGGFWSITWSVVAPCPPAGGGGGSCPVSLDLPGMVDPQAPCYSGEECQINSHCSEVLTDASCGHSKCAVGGALAPSCDSCVERVCDVDASCCTTAWTAACVALVESECDASCGAAIAPACSHDLCDIGPAVDAACSPDAADVCAVIPSCCTTSWNQACVDQLYVNETGSPPTATTGESLCDFAVLGSGSASVLSTTINGTMGWLADPVTMVGGSVTMVEQWPGAGYPTVTGDVYADGSLNISNGVITGDIYASGSVAASGTTANSITASAGVLPSPARPTVAMACPVPSPNYAYGWVASGTIPPGNYAYVQIAGPVTLAAGDYYIEDLTITGTGNLIMPATGNVNIYICNNFTMNPGSAGVHARVSSPGNNPLQMKLYVKNGVVNLMNWAEVVGTIQVEDGNIDTGEDVDIYGLLHSYRSTINTHRGTVIDSTGVTGAACITRGLDPNPPVSTCPVTTPLTSTVTETGTCIDNGVPPTHTESWCVGEADLALYMSCDADTVPICNHGSVAVPAGDAELVFYPRIASQFAGTEPATYWEAGRCSVTSAIAPGACVDQVCDSVLLDEDLTVRVELTASASVNECSDLDNWSYFVDAPACGGSPGAMTLNYEYEALCDSDKAASWGLLTWDSATPGASDITFRGRTATTSAGLASQPWIMLGQAKQAPAPNDTQTCWVGSTAAGCPPDLTGLLYSASPSNQGTFVELEITLESSGADAPTLNDWRVTYSCLEDQ